MRTPRRRRPECFRRIRGVFHAHGCRRSRIVSRAVASAGIIQISLTSNHKIIKRLFSRIASSNVIFPFFFLEFRAEVLIQPWRISQRVLARAAKHEWAMAAERGGTAAEFVDDDPMFES